MASKLKQSICFVFCIGVAITILKTANAFKPNEYTFGHTAITNAITQDDPNSSPPISFSSGWPGSLSTNGVVVGNVPPVSIALASETIFFREDARKHLIDGVQSNDWVTGATAITAAQFPQDIEDVVGFFRSELANPAAHCDDDLLADCALFIKARREDALSAIRSARNYYSDGDLLNANKQTIIARVYLGRALHTLQDFYAHSNYADINTGASGRFYEMLTRYIGGAPVLTENSVNTKVFDACVSRVFPPISWAINPGNYELTSDSFMLGRNEDKYTTGYFNNWIQGPGLAGSAPESIQFDAAGQVAVGGSRCDHGQGTDVSFLGVTPATISGIAKDAPFFPFYPAPNTVGASPNLHYQASYHAALHTKDFIEKFLKELRDDTSISNNSDEREAMVRLFMGERPYVALVIDRSGSMDDVMKDIADQIRDVVIPQEETSSRTVDRFGKRVYRKFVIQSYTENLVGGAYTPIYDTPISGTASFALEAMQRLVQRGGSGGGDCPEPTLGALKKAMESAPAGSKFHVFTDASAKSDTGALDWIKKRAVQRAYNVTFSLSGSCSPISPAYYDIAKASGGQVLLVDHAVGAASQAFAGIGAGLPDGVGGLHSVQLVQGTLLAGAVKSVVVPVESNASQLVINIANDSSGIAIRDPNGVLQTLTPFLGGASLKVNNPLPGNWTIGLSGWPTNPPGAPASAYSINAQVAGAFELAAATYSNATATGRAGHEINMPFGDSPPATDVRLTA